MRAAESHRNSEPVWQIGRQGEELGPFRRQALLQSPTLVSSGFVGGTLGSLTPTTASSELPAVPGSRFVGALQGDMARRVTHQDVASMVSASREMVSSIMRDLGVGRYLEWRRDEVRPPLPGMPPRRMSSLLERRNQAISVTEVARSTKNIIDRLASGQQDKYVVMRNNAPAAVLLSVAAYEALQDELADLRIEALARERLQSYDPQQAITHEDMVRRFAGE